MKLMKAPVQAQPKLSPIALFAGRGDLPKSLIHCFEAQNRPYVVLAFKGQSEPDLVKDSPHLWIHLGEVGKALKYLKENHIQDIVMAGALTRPSLSDIHPDWEGVKLLAKLGTQSRGDDSLLSFIIGALEEKGFNVVGANDLLENSLAPIGFLFPHQLDEAAKEDITRGVEILNRLSPLDVGQAVVIQQGLVLGIEAIEGTDALLQRAATLRRPGLGGVLVKLSKTGQESRVDLPTVGPETIRQASLAGLRGLVVEAEKTLILNKNELTSLAKENNLFVLGLSRETWPTDP